MLAAGSIQCEVSYDRVPARSMHSILLYVYFDVIWPYRCISRDTEITGWAKCVLYGLYICVYSGFVKNKRAFLVISRSELDSDFSMSLIRKSIACAAVEKLIAYLRRKGVSERMPQHATKTVLSNTEVETVTQIGNFATLRSNDEPLMIACFLFKHISTQR